MQESCLSQEVPLVSQDDEVLWISQWTLPLGCQMPILFKDTSLVSEQGPMVNELSCDEEKRKSKVSTLSDDCDKVGQQGMEMKIDA